MNKQKQPKDTDRQLMEEAMQVANKLENTQSSGYSRPDNNWYISPIRLNKTKTKNWTKISEMKT